MHRNPVRILSTVTLALGLAGSSLARSAPDLGGACQTLVPGGPVVNQTWTPAGSPYCVLGNITVSGLTIQPGVIVRLDPGVRINVGVALQATGTPAAPITFTWNVPNSPWGGIDFTSTPPGSELAHCRIEHSSDSGLRIINSSPTVRHCLVTHNSTANSGGGVVVLVSNADVLLEECAILDNTSAGPGGGLHAVMSGGFRLRLERCTVADNVANPSQAVGSYWGGGINFQGVGGVLELDQCVVSGNAVYSMCNWCNCTVSSFGGGMWADGGTVSLTRSTLRGNRSQAIDAGGCGGERGNGYGGGIAFGNDAGDVLTMANCIVSCNTSFLGASIPASYGDGVYVHAGTAAIENCTIARNGSLTAADTDGLYCFGGTVTVDSSILYWNNQIAAGPSLFGPQIRESVPDSITVSYSDVQNQGIVYPGPGNIEFNPVFVGGNDAGGCDCDDLAILPFSPCIDTGDPGSFDACLPPGLGTAACDMGAHGGPGNCASSLRHLGAEQGTALCFGDGSGNPCPCGNDSPTSGEGCLHSGNVGMTIRGVGTNRITEDDLMLVVEGAPASNSGIFYSGMTSLAPGSPLYDGLQCAGGNVRRYQGLFQANGTVCDTGFVAQDPSGTYFLCGATYYFQYWSRDVAMGPCGTLANFSPAYAVTMGP